MSNVIQLTFPSRSDQGAATIAALLDTFATQRRDMDDVFWLKENAEILNILECTGQEVAPEALAPYADFYNSLVDRLEFFPQYYRFLLSICLDLEALGLGGGQAQRLGHWVAEQGLPQAELSDLQRAEAQRLLTRCGVSDDAGADQINERLHGFVSRPATYAIPNKKAAYELTHIAFYLSEYGRKDPGFGAEARKSLVFAGTLAFLDCNWDLLAEILIAMRYAGMVPPAQWDRAIAQNTAGFVTLDEESSVRHDQYHEYLVCNWALCGQDAKPFQKPVPFGPVSFHSNPNRPAALRDMSDILYGLADRRASDWHLMKDYICENIAPEAVEILLIAEETCDDFEAFFAGFARTGLRGTMDLTDTSEGLRA